MDSIIQSLFELGPFGVVVCDEGCRIRRVNAAFARMVGRAPEELGGRFLAELAHPDELERDRQALHALREGRAAFSGVSKRFLRPDGEVVWTEMTVIPLQDPSRWLAAFVVDVTQRKQMEEALIESNQRFELLARAANDLFYDWHIPEGSLAWNEVLRTRYGHPPVTAVNSPAFWEAQIHPEDRTRVVTSLEQAMRSSEDLWSCEYRFGRADGTFAPVLDRGLFVRDPGGEPVRMLGVMVDLTELRETQAQLRQADRLASVGTLAAGVAHEINNPLGWTLNNLVVALGEIERVLPSSAPEDAARLRRALEALMDARNGSERVARIVRDLKTFARPDEDERAPVDLEQVMEAALSVASNELRHRARLVRDYARVPPVEGNESRLGQVFLNLIVNAAQAMPEGAAARHELRLTLREAEDGRVEALVSDTGPGIAPEILKHIFDPFFTTKARSVGTGLGLAICHGIVRAHGGEIDVDTAPGRGTTFRVRLPAAQPGEASALRMGGATASTGVLAPRARILVLDDEPLIGRALRRALMRHDVDAAGHGLEVLARAQAGETWDLILCDLMMPDMSGMDFFEELEKVAPALCERVVFMTGGAFTQRANTFFHTARNPRLEKPFEAAAVERVLTEVLWRQR